MGVNYKEQYRPDQLEPFWPHEICRMIVVVLCTLAVVMFLAILPSILEATGIAGVEHEAPANPRGPTPAGIKPEWYFLAVYQYLRLMPTELVGISGKTLGVLSQGVGIVAVVLLPFWYRRGAHRRPNWLYRITVTVCMAAFLCLTYWGGWPEKEVGGKIEEVSLGEFFHEHYVMFIMTGAALVVFFALLGHERRVIRRVLSDLPAEPTKKQEERP